MAENEEKKAEKVVYISFCADINQFTTEQLLFQTFKYLNEGYDHIYYLLSTTGGIISFGFVIYNTIKDLPIKTTIYNIGNVDSVGIALYLAGKERIACPSSSFLFHPVTRTINSVVNSKQLKEHSDSIGIDREKIARMILDRTVLKLADIDGLFRGESMKDAAWAVQGGVAHKMGIVEYVPGAPIVQLAFPK